LGKLKKIAALRSQYPTLKLKTAYNQLAAAMEDADDVLHGTDSPELRKRMHRIL